MKQLIFVLFVVFLFVGVSPLRAQTFEQMEEMCDIQCGAPTWDIAIPYGSYELTLEEETLYVVVHVVPDREGYITRWTATMPAAPSGALEPDPEWLRQQPPMVILEWRVEETPYEYQPGEVTYQVLPDGTRRSDPSPAPVFECNCERYHEGLLAAGATDEVMWSFHRTSDRALLWSLESACYQHELRNWFDVLTNSEYIGWVKPPGEDVWYTIRDVHQSGTYEMGTWAVRTRNCPPEEFRDRSSQD